MAYKSTRGKTGGKLNSVDRSKRSVLGQNIGGGGGGAASSPLTNPIYEISITSAPGPSGDNGTTIDLLQQTDYTKIFPGPGTWTIQATEDFPAIIELVGGGGGGGGGANAGQPGPSHGGGGSGGDAVFSGTPVGTVTANGGQGGRGGKGEVGGTPDSDRNGQPGSGGTADTSSALPSITFSTTSNGSNANGSNKGPPSGGAGGNVPAVANRNQFNGTVGGANGGGHGGGGNPGNQTGGGGGAAQGAYIRSNGFDLEGGVTYTFTVGGAGNGGSGGGSGGTGSAASAAIQINFYDPS